MSGATHFVVKRLRWCPNYSNGFHRLPGEVRVASFATIDEADADCRQREEAVRKRVNPFACGHALHYQTHLDEPRLRDWLMDHGLDPPKPGKKGKTNWAAWWKEKHKKFSATQRAAVWEALGKVRFFTIAEEPRRPVGYAVVRVNWVYNDENFDADPEGGELLKVFRARDRAEQECESRNEEAREQWGEGYEYYDTEHFNPETDMGMFDMQDRVTVKVGIPDPNGPKRVQDVFPSPAGTPFFEIIEVELEGLT